MDAVSNGSARVVEHDGAITGYTTGLAIDCHAVGHSNTDLQALMASGDGFRGTGMLIPSRNTELFHWCLNNGLRVVKQMILMSVGLYNEPQGRMDAVDQLLTRNAPVSRHRPECPRSP